MNWSRSLAVLAFLAATPAAAQPYPEPYYGIVSPREVMRTVASMGLQPVSEPRLHGNVWVVRGAGREGTIVRVALDSHTGRVLEMHAMRRAAYMGPGPYQPDPRYVMRDAYPSEAYPAPRAGEVYEAEPPYYPGPNGAVPDEDEYDQPVPQPRGYVPHSSNAAPGDPRLSAKPEAKRLASRPQHVPLPKARPDDAKSSVKIDAAKQDAGKKEEAKKEEKKEDAKKEMAKQEEPKKEDVKSDSAAKPLTSPKDPETTASIAASHQKEKAKTEPKKPEPKKVDLPPVQPLE